MANPICPVLMPVVPYIVVYECGQVLVTDPTGVTTVFTELIKYTDTSVTLSNGVVTNTYDLSTGFDIVEIQAALSCSDTSGLKLDPEVVCMSDNGGKTILKGLIEFDTSVSPVVSTLRNFDGTLATGFEVVNCSQITLYDYEHKETCVNGLPYTRVYIWDKTISPPALVAVAWLDEGDAIVPEPDRSLINNQNCFPACIPQITSAYGNDLSTLSSGHSIAFSKPACCEVQVTTSAGVFILPKGMTAYSTTDFNCDISVDAISIVSGNCSLNQIHIISNLKS